MPRNVTLRVQLFGLVLQRRAPPRPASEMAYTALQEWRLATIHSKWKEIASDRSRNARSPLLQFPKACHAISGIINLVNSATHPSKHADGHELLASIPPLALASGDCKNFGPTGDHNENADSIFDLSCMHAEC